jgi:hypothetical protein
MSQSVGAIRLATACPGASAQEQIARAELARVPGVEAIFGHRESDGRLQVYAVVPEHSEALHQELMVAHGRISARIRSDRWALHVRARQGRDAQCAVPPWCRLLLRLRG